MTQHTDPLDHVRVAAPCSSDWESMSGNSRVRFCHKCDLNVYNLSGMTKRQAEALIMGAEGRLCVRFYRRADGSILTNNCPVGLRALKRRASRLARATISTVLGFLAGLGAHVGLRSAPETATMGTMISDAPKFEVSYETTGALAVEPEAAVEVLGEPMMMGRMAPTQRGWEKGEMLIEEPSIPTPHHKKSRINRTR